MKRSLAREAVERYHSNPEVVTVAVERLDDYLDQLTRSVSLIKMDVQGAELPALQGAEHLIRQDRPALILEVDEDVTSAFGYCPEDLGAYLHDLGYVIYSVPVRPWQQPARLDWRKLHSHDILCLSQSKST